MVCAIPLFIGCAKRWYDNIGIVYLSYIRHAETVSTINILGRSFNCTRLSPSRLFLLTNDFISAQ